ncbi:DUF2922 domain-containing protein [Desulforamulus aquiferis]|uniref:DUF2922 domain-containing protein n=1 Tax=Desulforamulus aquiferis TaxID=1397668 RepID=A0AAW7ZGK6_9FIRM|nr:DUF2922 domain-containing protein [Desulforamulus aquiferis]MDO7787950.1 DUF2922 domain-containing protein [Desulforamulus aquiferis]RYD07085.1 hypothetical protein N752_00450 [Desulforamulus aquiferis]
MAQTLELIFINEAGSKVTLRVSDPKENLQATEVKAAMDQIVSSNVFYSTGGNLVSAAGARVVNRDVVEMELI